LEIVQLPALGQAMLMMLWYQAPEPPHQTGFEPFFKSIQIGLFLIWSSNIGISFF
jgi:hypothetical protein